MRDSSPETALSKSTASKNDAYSNPPVETFHFGGEMTKPGHTARGRWSALFFAALTAMMLAGFVALTSSDSASANHNKKGSKVSVVANVFNLEGGRTVPPVKMRCVWSDKYETYNCQAKHFRQLLTTKNQSDDTDYLPRGGDYLGGDVVNPHEFSCERPTKDPSTVTPSDYKCRDSNHKFRLNQMVYLIYPENCDSSSPKCIEFVLPPRK
ncbi:hypothetical protein LFT45_10500 [Arthrobacter sp. FW305-BF8]|uniref:hypothetical protein n=1 Tax=Arthrobacter sp. FW305-BF8 TaxID=2879617 RepID=UPI001F18B707|nr:hypothetical protein [Arthrobacter sp. FW305-BF8]UKA56285.1 hypothetical protein LFT45_10500 [Arthrobacter sp. FW305-BF8]